jgi:PAS domain S-box-containing protein
VTLLDSGRRYVAANPAFQKMIGYSEAELRRLSPVEITHEDEGAETQAIVAAGIVGGPFAQPIEKRYRRQDGGVIWAEVNGFQASMEGSASLLGAVAVDITERKLAEAALRDARADL